MRIFNPGETAPVTLTASFLPNAKVIDLPIKTISPDAIYEALVPVDVAAVPPAEVRFVDTNNIPVPAADILPALGFNNSATLNQTVVDVRIAYVATGRALIFKVNDSTAALGSLLAWENNMASSLKQILNISDNAKSGRFTDLALSKTDIRVLYAEEGPVLLYGFIDSNTVVIARNINTFTTMTSPTK